MKKRIKPKYKYYRVALCRGLGFLQITEEEFVEVYLDGVCDNQIVVAAPRYLFMIHTEHRESCGKKCSDDYLYIRKRLRGK